LTHIHASFSGVIYFEATAFFSPSPPSAFGVIYFEAMRAFAMHINEVSKYTGALLRSQQIDSEVRNQETYFKVTPTPKA